MSLKTCAVLGLVLVVGNIATNGGDGVTHDPSLEQVPADEARQIQNIVQLTIAQMKQRYSGNQFVMRGAHPKDHGCVMARFKVSDDLAEELKVGVFSKPGREYQAWIRFSNAAVRTGPDSPPVKEGSPEVKHGSRGMAIKLLGVGGTPLLDEAGPHTQDFLMVNHPVFVFANVEDYEVLSKVLLQNGDDPGGFFKERIRLDPAGKPNLADPATRRARRSFQIAGRIQSPSKAADPPAYQEPPASPVDNCYFSAAPYSFGPDGAMKFRARPVAPETGTAPKTADPNYLRAALYERLATPNKRLTVPNKGLAASTAPDVVFEFQVQVRTKAELAGKLETEIEDACTEWDEGAYKFATVATITIPPQDFNTPERRLWCEEHLIFTPWHGIKDHQPLGGINRLKLEVYKASSSFRHVPKEPAAF